MDNRQASKRSIVWLQVISSVIESDFDEEGGVMLSNEATNSPNGPHKDRHSRHAFERLEFIDPLTGLPNRDLFFDRMDHELARARRYESGFALMKLDLDEFTEVNKAKGQAAGDRVLQDVAKLLTANVRDIDTVARLGGDEFAILLDGVTNKKEAETIALKIIRSMSDPINLEDGTQIRIGASVSIALSPQDGTQAVQLMMCADQAMNVAKNNGKGLVGFSKSMQESPVKHAQAMPVSPDNAMNLGIHIIDAQHAAMENFIRGLLGSIKNGDRSVSLSKRIDLLVELCRLHFQTEEDMMKQHDLPGVEEHHAEHMRRLASLRAIFGNLDIDEKKLETVTREIDEWLLGHIRGQDSELVAMLKSKGVS
jgi:diguanylate cyclase (GGDEF)-like protein/hemerythrin-like metal-binding protein